MDSWLGARQAPAALEASSILNEMSASGDGAETLVRETAGRTSAALVIFTARRAVRAMLVFRAVLVAVLLGLGLDNSDFESTDLGKKIVFLR